MCSAEIKNDVNRSYTLYLDIEGDDEMKGMKKLAALFLAVMLLVCAAGCGKDKSDKKNKEKDGEAR